MARFKKDERVKWSGVLTTVHEPDPDIKGRIVVKDLGAYLIVREADLQPVPKPIHRYLVSTQQDGTPFDAASRRLFGEPIIAIEELK